jgi:hypothetical protein
MKKYMKCIFFFSFSGHSEVGRSKNHRFVFEFCEKNVDFDEFLSGVISNHDV